MKERLMALYKTPKSLEAPSPKRTSRSGWRDTVGMNLTYYDAACQAVAKCARIDEAKDIADKARALKAYARQAHNVELEIQATELRVRAKRRIGELSGELETIQGENLPNVPTLGRSGKRKALEAAGISTSEAHRCEQLASIPEAEVLALFAKCRDLGKPVSSDELLRKAGRANSRASHLQTLATQPWPTGKFSLIYADPPWRYEHTQTESRAIENQYPTMSLDEIKALEVPAADNCVLFLWATSPKLAEAMEVIQAWGFTYRTCAVWDKEVLGMGYYFRQQHELLLVATLGEPGAPPESARISSVIRSRRRSHSVKPAMVYEIIEGMYPYKNKLELFARITRPGWTRWGGCAITFEIR